METKIKIETLIGRQIILNHSLDGINFKGKVGIIRDAAKTFDNLTFDNLISIEINYPDIGIYINRIYSLEDYITMINNRSIIISGDNELNNLFEKQSITKEDVDYKTIIYRDRNLNFKYGFVIKSDFNNIYTYAISSLDKRFRLYKNDIKDRISDLTNNYEVFEKVCKCRIKDIKESSELFGRRIIKSKMFRENKKYSIKTIDKDFICKKDGVNRDTILIYDDNNISSRFLLKDVELIYPNLNIQLPKDRKLSKGVVCKIKDDRKLPIKKGEKVTILDIINYKNTNNSNIINYKVKTESNKTLMLKGKNIKVC